MIGARASLRCELCRRERRHGQEAIEHLPEETVAHIQSADQDVKRKRRASLGLTAVVEVSSLCHHHHGEAKHNFEFIEDKDRQLESLWRETNIGNFMILSSPPSLSCFRL